MTELTHQVSLDLFADKCAWDVSAHYEIGHSKCMVVSNCPTAHCFFSMCPQIVAAMAHLGQKMSRSVRAVLVILLQGIFAETNVMTM